MKTNERTRNQKYINHREISILQFNTLWEGHPGLTAFKRKILNKSYQELTKMLFQNGQVLTQVYDGEIGKYVCPVSGHQYDRAEDFLREIMVFNTIAVYFRSNFDPKVKRKRITLI